MQRKLWLLGLVVVLGVAGCSASREAEAERDARTKAAAAVRDIAGPPRIWPAEALGRRAVNAGFELLRVEGVESGTTGAGVTLTVRVIGHGADRDPLYHSEENPIDLPFCFLLRFGELHVYPKPELIECPAGPAISYPPLETPPALPDEKAVTQSLAGVAVDVSAVKAALATLDLDPRLQVDVRADGGRIGVALRSFAAFNVRNGCVLIQIGPAQVYVWRLSRAQDQPGELSCSAAEAIAGSGMRPPH